MCNYLYTPLPFCNLHGSVSTPVVSCFVSLNTVIVYMYSYCIYVQLLYICTVIVYMYSYCIYVQLLYICTVIVYMSTFIYVLCMCAKCIAQRGQCQETNTVWCEANWCEADWCISLVRKHM